MLFYSLPHYIRRNGLTILGDNDNGNLFRTFLMNTLKSAYHYNISTFIIHQHVGLENIKMEGGGEKTTVPEPLRTIRNQKSPT